jgi:hypothetical protein
VAIILLLLCKRDSLWENAAYPEPGGAEGRPRVPGEAGQEQRGHQEVPGAGQEQTERDRGEIYETK